MGLANSFRQELATLKSGAKDLVWLTVCYGYFTDSLLGGGEGRGGSEASAPHVVTLPGTVGQVVNDICLLFYSFLFYGLRREGTRVHQTGNNASRKKYIFFSFICIVQKVLAALITSTELHNGFRVIYK